jgi:hypothetical protein
MNRATSKSTKELYLFADEYPADIYQSDLFCMAVIYCDSINDKTPAGKKEKSSSILMLKSDKLICFCGYVHETELIRKYMNNQLKTLEGKFTGINTLWSAMLSYSTVGFIKAFFREGLPLPINLFYDPKSMTNRHRISTHHFLQTNICEFYKSKTGRNLNIIVNEGSKNMLGILMADKVARLVFESRGHAEKVSKIRTRDFTNALEANVKENPHAFGLGGCTSPEIVDTPKG